MNRRVLAGAAVLLIAGCGSSNPAATPTGSVSGVVLSAPSCPVERVGKPCPPRPVSGATVDALRNGDVIASTRSGPAGRFRLVLPAGQYLIRATNVGLHTTAQRRVTVDGHEGPAVVVRLVVDSGIR